MGCVLALSTPLLATTSHHITSRFWLFLHTHLRNPPQGDHWYNASGWCTAALVGSWYGVSMHDITRRIIGLELRDNDIVGPIPRVIGKLKLLRWLLLGNNPKITGEIPLEIGFLRELRQLDFHNCPGITGESSTACVFWWVKCGVFRGE